MPTREMTAGDIARRRLESQYLVAPTLSEPMDVVRALGAVQAQDYANAKWAVAQRTRGLTDAEVERAMASGAILRTHVLRPTWHFVLPEDVRWMLELTAPRVGATMAYYNRKLELDAKVFRKSNAALERALRDGKQFTYALFDERVPIAKPRDRDESLHDLTRRYFTTRGPATRQDFAWWSGLSVADAKRGIDAAGSLLAQATYDGRSYWSAVSGVSSRHRPRLAHLLPNYDELFVGFRDRSAFAERLRSSGGNPRVDALVGNILFIDGQIVGGWRRALVRPTDLELRLLVSLTATEDKLVRRAVDRFGAFLGSPVEVRSRRATSRPNSRTMVW